MSIDPLAGKPAPPEKFINLAELLTDYYTLEPRVKVSFGTSGHRGSAFKGAFNEGHVAAVTKAVVEYRHQMGYKGPIFLGYDTHALSEPAFRTALSVLAAMGVWVVINANNEYSPTPVVWFMILG
ncbi:MAG: phosphoglucomutase, alpha-D-glucose phosphate-specific, partial [Deltaproteobacteria bacterium]|nr:phosphoglucomutase, alpha-D-glucose phosphate-specific [Deltaproteobacteria bacterium]